MSRTCFIRGLRLKGKFYLIFDEPIGAGCEPMPDICLILEVHQPLRLNRNFHAELLSRPKIAKEELFELYFDSELNRHVLERAARKCYFPSNEILLEQINRFKDQERKFKVSFGISGVFIEQCQRWLPELIESFKQLAETECVEFLDEPYYHSLASLYGVDRSEFVEQVLMHRKLMEEILGYKPNAFENTECLYNNAIAKTIEGLGYKAMITEGVERILGWRSPNYVYRAKDCNLRVLLRNYRLSDDVGFRFSSRWWDQWPLFADKYANWLANTPGQVIVIFMDYETFGEHHWPESGIHEFLRHLPGEVLRWGHLSWCTPSEAVEKHPPAGEMDVPEHNTISWADLERDTSAWIGNPMQNSCYEALKQLEPLVKGLGVLEYVKLWRLFQQSDHLYYMSTKGGGPGEVHSYFNPYGSPIGAFVVFSRILSDFEARVLQELRSPPLAARWLLRRVPAEKGFTFFYEFARPTGIAAHSLEEFCQALKKVSLRSIRFHLERGDFERWISQVVGDEELAGRIKQLASQNYKGEVLRRGLVSLIEDRVEELKATARSKGGS